MTSKKKELGWIHSKQLGNCVIRDLQSNWLNSIYKQRTRIKRRISPRPRRKQKWNEFPQNNAAPGITRRVAELIEAARRDLIELSNCVLQLLCEFIQSDVDSHHSAKFATAIVWIKHSMDLHGGSILNSFIVLTEENLPRGCKLLLDHTLDKVVYNLKNAFESINI